MANYTSTISLTGARVQYNGSAITFDEVLQSVGITNYIISAYTPFVTITTDSPFSVSALDALITAQNTALSTIELLAKDWPELYVDFRAARNEMMSYTPTNEWDSIIFWFWAQGKYVNGATTLHAESWFLESMRNARIERWNKCNVVLFGFSPAIALAASVFLVNTILERQFIINGEQGDPENPLAVPYILDFINSTKIYAATGLLSYGVDVPTIAVLTSIIKTGQ